MKALKRSWGRAICFAVLMILTFCLGAANALLFSEDNEGIKVPILMYHSILKDPARSGKYVVTPAQLEEDLSYLKEHGYTTIVMDDLIQYVYQGRPLPEKPVMITLDDGHLNNLTYLLPLLEQYDMKAVISIVGSYAQRATDLDDHNPNYAYLDWNEIHTLVSSGRVEIQNHTYAMHDQSSRRGARRKSGETLDSYREALRADLSRTQQALVEFAQVPAPTTFTYPFGQISEESEEVLTELGFLASLSCYERVNVITRDTRCLYQLGRYNRPSGISTAKFMKKLGIAQDE